MATLSKSHKSQIYLTDYIVGILIFFLFISIYYFYEPNILAKVDFERNDLLLEAKTISISLLSQGVPTNWNNNNVIRIGLTNDDQTINITKIKNFYNMSYENSTKLLNVKNDFYVFLRDKNGNQVSIRDGSDIFDSHGYYNETLSDEVSRITRIVAYNKSLYELVVYSWREDYES